MKKITRRSFLQATAASAAALALSSCSSSDSTSTTTSTSAAGTSSTGSDEPVTLNFICTSEFEGSCALGDLNDLFSRYSDIAPNVTIQGEYVPSSELDSKILVANAGGVHYDIILVNNSSVATFAKAGVLADMTDYAERDGYDMEEIFVPALAQASRYEDKIYGFPWNTDTRLLAVNATMLAEAGINDMPETMEDMLTIAEAVTKDLDGDGSIDQYGYALNIARTTPCVYFQGIWMASNGVHVYDDGDVEGQYVCNMDSPEGIEYFQWVVDMAQYIPNDLISYDNDMLDNAFCTGKFAMCTFGTWNIGDEEFETTVAATGFDCRYILCPSGANGVKTSLSGGYLFGVSADSTDLDAAWEVIKFLTNPEVDAELCSTSGIPAVQASYDYAPFNTETYDIVKEQLETSEMAVSAFIPEFSETVDCYGNNLIAAALGEKTAEEAAIAAAAEINEILKDAGYQA